VVGGEHTNQTDEERRKRRNDEQTIDWQLKSEWNANIKTRIMKIELIASSCQ